MAPGFAEKLFLQKFGLAAIFFFIYLKEHQREESFPFPVLFYSPNDCKSHGWARLKPGTWNSILISHMGEGPKPLDHLLLLSQTQ